MVGAKAEAAATHAEKSAVRYIAAMPSNKLRVSAKLPPPLPTSWGPV